MNTRTPASEAGMHADITECSDSGVMISAGKLPSAWNSVSFSSTGVCGVIGYTGTTWGRASRAAQATAWLPVNNTLAVPAFTAVPPASSWIRSGIP